MNEAASAKKQQENEVADKHKEEKGGSPSLNMNELRELADLIDEYNLVDFEFENDNIRVHMRKQMPQMMAQPVEYAAPQMAAAAPPAVAPASSDASAAEAPAEPVGQVIVSPIPGKFYQSPSPDAPPFVSVGDKVKKGQILCIIEAMKLMNEIESDYDGVVTEIHVNNEQAVEYGHLLYSISPV
jgi:acetyl-CoA carboxylase biotin carboxyl carrier protein